MTGSQTSPTIIITRPRPRAERFAAQCLEIIGRDVPILIAPVVRIELGAVPDLSAYDSLIFTSEAAVEAISGNTAPETAWAVGDRTAAAAKLAGFSVHNGGGSVATLTERLIKARPKGRLLHLRGAESHGNLASALVEAGLLATEAIVYRQADAPVSDAAITALRGDDPLILPVFSQASARRLLALDIRAPHFLVALSPAIAAVWPHGHGEARVAAEPTAESMAHTIAEVYE